MTATERDGKKTQNTQELLGMVWDIRDSQTKTRQQLFEISEQLGAIKLCLMIIAGWAIVTLAFYLITWASALAVMSE